MPSRGGFSVRFKKTFNRKWKHQGRNDVENPKRRSIKEVFDNESHLKNFYRFLVLERNQENLDFWLEVECYRMADAPSRRMISMYINDNYLVSGTDQEVNISQSTLATITRQLKETELLPDTLFDKAQKEVLLILENGPWVRFKEKKGTQLRAKSRVVFRPLDQYLKTVVKGNGRHGVTDHLKQHSLKNALYENARTNLKIMH